MTLLLPFAGAKGKAASPLLNYPAAAICANLRTATDTVG